MKKKIVGIFVMTLLITTSFTTIAAVNMKVIENESIYIKNVDGGWLEERDGIRILHLNGSNYDMGFQHGFLIGDSVAENYRAFRNMLEHSGFSYEEVLEIWDIMDDYLPDEYKEEMQGLADGSGLDLENIIMINMVPALANHIFLNISCCGVSMWGDATVDGSLYHVRGFDGSIDTNDPVTGRYVQENIIIIVRNPERGYASVAPEFAGHVGNWNGVNEMEICVSETTVLTEDTTFHGISAFFRMRMVLDYAATAEEAIEILNSNRTCGWNFIVSDGKVPVGYALEQTANFTYVGTWDNPNENVKPFWKIKNVVRRVPMFVSPELAEIEYGRPFYKTGGIRGVLLALLGISYTIFGWAHYKALSKVIDQRYGTFNLNNTLEALREEYKGKTDFLMRLAMLFGGYIPVYQYVVCPSTGGLTISFASIDTMAHEDEIPIHYFNIYELLNSTPP